ncbi:hypothetical protein [Solimonas marina]|uniref:Alpha-2-macroglobulin MG1 domain-containing protein n=1 Tax=Solimonas marina TaxID=2714601 RepID=A0A969WDX3_9GAMM|nr:hypothetical protein [Solimonas marina]NKF23596.1 hypothetical protein [Solimonas marina]
MSGEFVLESGTDPKVKFSVLAAIIAAFAIGAVLLMKPGSTTHVAAAKPAAAAPAARVPAQPAAPPAQSADPYGDAATADAAEPAQSWPDAAPPAETSAPTTFQAATEATTAMPSTADSGSPAASAAQAKTATASSADDSASQPLQTFDDSADADADADAGDALSANAGAQPTDMNDLMASPPAASASSHRRAEDHPRPAVRAPSAPAIEALHAWWRSDKSGALAVQYVGPVAGEQALVVRLSQSVANANDAAQHIHVVDQAGANVAGNWSLGSNPYVLVYQGVQPGRYTVRIDPALRSASGTMLGTTLQGPVFVQ